MQVQVLLLDRILLSKIRKVSCIALHVMEQHKMVFKQYETLVHVNVLCSFTITQ